MKRALVFSAIFLIVLLSGVLCFRHTLVHAITHYVLYEVGKVPVSVGPVHIDWSERRVWAENLRFGDADSDSADATSAEVFFDLGQLWSRRLLLPKIRLEGIVVHCPTTDCAFIRMIDEIATPPRHPHFIKTDVGELTGKNFGQSIFFGGAGTIALTPSSLRIGLVDGAEDIVGEGAISLSWQTPSALKSISRFNGTLHLAGRIKSPAIAVTVLQETSSPQRIKLAGSLEDGVLKIEPSMVGFESSMSGRIEYQLVTSSLNLDSVRLSSFPLRAISEELGDALLNLSAQGNVSIGKLAGAVQGELSVAKLPLRFIENGSLQFDATPAKFTLAKIQLQGSGGELNGEIHGHIFPLALEGKIETNDFKIYHSVKQDLREEKVALTGTLEFDGPFTDLHLRGPIELTLSRKRFAVETIRKLFTMPVTLDLRGNAHEFRSAAGTITIDPFSFQDESANDVHLEKPLKFVLKDEVFQLAGGSVSIGTQKIQLEGSLSKTKGYDFLISGEASLEPVLGQIHVLEDPKGDVKARLHLTGQLTQPVLNGRIDISDASFGVPFGQEGVNLSDIDGAIEFDDSQLRIRSLTNNSGDAKLSISGVVNDFLSTDGREGDLDWKLERLEGEPSPGFETRLHGAGKLRFSGAKRPLLTGQIDVDELRYEQRTDLRELVSDVLGLLLSRSKRSNTGSSIDVLPVDLSIAIKADRSIPSDTDLAQVELSSNLKAETREAKPIISGKIESDSGELIFGKTRLNISRAAAIFRETPVGESPIIDLRADGELGVKGAEELVQLEVHGKLPNPQIVIGSESGRNEREILSLLGLGLDRFTVAKTPQNVSFVDILNPFSGTSVIDRVTGLTGVTEVEIETGYSADTGEFAPRLLLTRPLPLDLNLVAQAELTQFARTSVNAEYSLTEQANVFLGWRNAPSTNNPESLTGSFGLGLHYRERFEGKHLFPGDLILENLKGLIP